MNRLPRLIETFVHRHFCAIKSPLAHIYRIRQDVAPAPDSIRVGALLDVDAFGF